MQAHRLLEGLNAAYLLADKGYDADAILDECEAAGLESVIPPKRNRRLIRDYDKDIYCERHLVENAFEKLKRWRGMATRYAKKTSSFLAAVHIRCLVIWLGIS